MKMIISVIEFLETHQISTELSFPYTKRLCQESLYSQVPVAQMSVLYCIRAIGQTSLFFISF